MPEIETVDSVAAPRTRRTRKPSGDSPPKAKRARGGDDGHAAAASTTQSPARRSRAKRSSASPGSADAATTPAEANPLANAAGAEAPAGVEPAAPGAIEEAVPQGAIPAGDEESVSGPVEGAASTGYAASAPAAGDPAVTSAEANPLANAAGTEALAGDGPDAHGAIDNAALGVEEQGVGPGAMAAGDDQPVSDAVHPVAGAASVEDTGTAAASPQVPRELATDSAPAPLPIPTRPAVGRSRPAPPTFKQTVLSAAAERFRGDMVRQPVTEQQVDQMLVLLHRRGPSTSLRSSTYAFLRRGMSRGHAEVQIEKLRAAVAPGDVRAAA